MAKLRDEFFAKLRRSVFESGGNLIEAGAARLVVHDNVRS